MLPRLASAQEQPVRDVVATSAAPRSGRGASALIGGAPAAELPLRLSLGLGDSNVVATATPKGSAPSVPAATAASVAPAKSYKAWAIPPIRWGGYLAMELRSTISPGQPRQVQVLEVANLNASSYIWQPWFAQVSADFNITSSQQREGGGSPGAASATGGGIKSTSLSGNAQLAFLPQSRFPFTASFSESESRSSGDFFNSPPYTNRRYALTQSYTPAQSGSSYRLSYTRSDIISETTGTDTAKAFNATGSWSLGANSLSVNTERYLNARSNSEDGSATKSLYASHSYRPNPAMSLDNLFNYNASQYHLTGAGQPLDLLSRVLQLSSFANWRPEDNPALTASAGVRLYQNSTSTNDASADSRIFSANASASYALNRNTILNGSGGVSQVSNGGSSSVFSNQSAGIRYGSDAIKLGNYAYNWTAGTNLGNQTGGDSSSRSINANINHQLSRSFSLGAGSSLGLGFSQDFSLFRDTLFSASRSLQQSVNASWSTSLGESANTGLNLNFSDSRSKGDLDQHFQFLNLQANGQMRFGRWASANANLNFQATRQEAASSAADSFGTSVGGSLSYQHSRFFGVPRLRYNASLNLNQYQDRSRLQGDIDAPLEHVSWSVEQRLDYDIGRLQTQLSLRFAEVEGNTNGMIFFKVLRQFGR